MIQTDGIFLTMYLSYDEFISMIKYEGIKNQILKVCS